MRSTVAGGGSAPSVVTARPASQEAATAEARSIARRFIIRRLKDASFRQKSQNCHRQKTPRKVHAFQNKSGAIRRRQRSGIRRIAFVRGLRFRERPLNQTPLVLARPAPHGRDIPQRQEDRRKSKRKTNQPKQQKSRPAHSHLPTRPT